MTRLAFTISVLLCLFWTYSLSADHHESKLNQIIELRYYHIKSPEAAKLADEYLTKALVPALNRTGIESVGVFREEEEKSEPLRLVVMGHKSITDFAQLNAKLGKDKKYQEAAASYMGLNGKNSPLLRVRSEVLHSFDCWPKLKVPKLTKQPGRIFELRIYESANQRFGDLKVEMFNAGEVPIFLDSGIMPVFMGQAIAGDKMPNLTYMTVYKDEAEKAQGWDNFRKHPDWQVLKEVSKYKGTVSKIHKLDLVPLEGSQL